jgi:hypothetical protein
MTHGHSIELHKFFSQLRIWDTRATSVHTYWIFFSFPWENCISAKCDGKIHGWVWRLWWISLCNSFLLRWHAVTKFNKLNWKFCLWKVLFRRKMSLNVLCCFFHQCDGIVLLCSAQSTFTEKLINSQCVLACWTPELLDVWFLLYSSPGYLIRSANRFSVVSTLVKPGKVSVYSRHKDVMRIVEGVERCWRKMENGRTNVGWWIKINSPQKKKSSVDSLLKHPNFV